MVFWDRQFDYWHRALLNNSYTTRPILRIEDLRRQCGDRATFRHVVWHLEDVFSVVSVASKVPYVRGKQQNCQVLNSATVLRPRHVLPGLTSSAMVPAVWNCTRVYPESASSI